MQTLLAINLVHMMENYTKQEEDDGRRSKQKIVVKRKSISKRIFSIQRNNIYDKRALKGLGTQKKINSICHDRETIDENLLWRSVRMNEAYSIA